MSECILDIERLDSQGRGVAFFEGKIVFVEGALAGERVRAKIILNKKRYFIAQTLEVLSLSDLRVPPSCAYAELCGGCTLQHLKTEAQAEIKASLWCEQLKRIGKINLDENPKIIAKDSFAYRRRARLAYDSANNALGFRAKASHQIVDIAQCMILRPKLSAVLPALKDLLAEFSDVKSVQIVEGEKTCALAIEADGLPSLARLKEWQNARETAWQIWLNQQCVLGDEADLFYTIDGIKINFAPDDFIQVNAQINLALFETMLAMLGDVRGKRVVDFFAGLGNFSRPLLSRGANLEAVEGDDAMVERLAHALENTGEESCARKANLFAPKPSQLKKWLNADIWILDPPRAGAKELLSALAKAKEKVGKIVYISCDSASFARDAQILLSAGYKLSDLRLAEMFAQTAHLESIACFLL